MKLDNNILKQLIKETKLRQTMLLEEPIIAESSFNRIKDKIDNSNISFVVMSADRHEKSRNENDVRNQELKAAWKAAGYPFTEIDGSWLEKDEDGNEVRVIEKSIVVTDEERGDVERNESDLFEKAKELSSKYEQDAFIFGETGSRSGKRYIDAFSSDGSRVEYGGPWTSLEPIEKDADFWSRVRGSTFVFKEYYGKDKDHKYPEKVKPKKDDDVEDVKFKKMEESLDIPAGSDTAAMAKDLEGSTIRAVYTQMMDQTNDKKGFQKTRLHKDLRNLTGTAEAYDTQKIEQLIKNLFDGKYNEHFALSLARLLKDGYLKKHFVQSDEMFKEEIEVDAPNSVIEAMIKAEMHKNKKIKFVRRKK